MCKGFSEEQRKDLLEALALYEVYQVDKCLGRSNVWHTLMGMVEDEGSLFGMISLTCRPLWHHYQLPTPREQCCDLGFIRRMPGQAAAYVEHLKTRIEGVMARMFGQRLARPPKQVLLQNILDLTAARVTDIKRAYDGTAEELGVRARQAAEAAMGAVCHAAAALQLAELRGDQGGIAEAAGAISAAAATAVQQARMAAHEVAGTSAGESPACCKRHSRKCL